MSNSNNNGAAGRSRSRSSSNTTNGSKKTYSNEKYTAVIEAMVLRAHMVEGREGYSPDHHHHRLVRHQPGQGPLLPQELADLSLLCSANSSSSSKNKNQATTKKSNRQEQQQQEDAALKGFASVDGDQLAALIELLDKHVNLAARVSLIEDALNIIKKAGSPSIASDAIDQVRIIFVSSSLSLYANAVRVRQYKRRKLPSSLRRHLAAVVFSNVLPCFSFFAIFATKKCSAATFLFAFHVISIIAWTTN